MLVRLHPPGDVAHRRRLRERRASRSRYAGAPLSVLPATPGSPADLAPMTVLTTSAAVWAIVAYGNRRVELIRQ